MFNYLSQGFFVFWTFDDFFQSARFERDGYHNLPTRRPKPEKPLYHDPKGIFKVEQKARNSEVQTKQEFESAKR